MVLRDQIVHTEHLDLMSVFILILGKHRRILQKEKGFQYSYITKKTLIILYVCGILGVLKIQNPESHPGLCLQSELPLMAVY